MPPGTIPAMGERFGYPMEYGGRIPKCLVHRMIFWNTANNCLILTFGVCVPLLIRILIIKTNPYEQPFSMKQIIKNLGATLFTLDIFILCVFLSRLLKMLISNDLYRYFHFGYMIFLVFLALFTLQADTKMPSTKEMTREEKNIWFFLQFGTSFSLMIYLLWDLFIAGFLDNPIVTDRVQTMLICFSLFMSLSFFMTQFIFLKKYWRAL